MSVTGDWDRRISRRTLLRTGGSLAAGAALAGPLASRALAAPPFEGDPTFAVENGRAGAVRSAGV